MYETKDVGRVLCIRNFFRENDVFFEKNTIHNSSMIKINDVIFYNVENPPSNSPIASFGTLSTVFKESDFFKYFKFVDEVRDDIINDIIDNGDG